jgi:predicted phage terminase large subunit-like protein
LLIEPLRKIHNPRFGAVIFRRTYPQITNEGGMWDTAATIYSQCGAKPRLSELEWQFPSKARVTFAHMQHEDDRYQWDGSQIPLIGFDQLEHFEWRQFFYMLARNRTGCGVRPYIRATCNPDPDHWLRSFLSWWIDEKTGLPIRERSGRLRWVVMAGDHPDWADSREQLIERHGPDTEPKSFTFIPGRVEDNQELLRHDPGYLANLKLLPLVERERLLHGNWNIRYTAGNVFQRGWFPIVDAAPALIDVVRYWDRAATPASGNGNGSHRASWTVGVKMGRDVQGAFYVLDVDRFQGSPMAVADRIRNIASQDGIGVRVGIEQDPGQAGKAEAEGHVRALAGFSAVLNAVHEAKGLRARPLSAQAEAGNVKLLRALWNDAYLRELENFDGTDACVADQVDASSGAFHVLTSKTCGVSFVTNIGQGVAFG